MNRQIVGVDYRHPILTAYLKVVGRTKLEGERFAKQIGTRLKDLLPTCATIGPARYRGLDGRNESFEIPIIIAECESAAKAALAKLVLQGSV